MTSLRVCLAKRTNVVDADEMDAGAALTYSLSLQQRKNTYQCWETTGALKLFVEVLNLIVDEYNKIGLIGVDNVGECFVVVVVDSRTQLIQAYEAVCIGLEY